MWRAPQSVPDPTTPGATRIVVVAPYTLKPDPGDAAAVDTRWWLEADSPGAHRTGLA